MSQYQVCSVCHGKGYTTSSSKEKIDCGACNKLTDFVNLDTTGKPSIRNPKGIKQLGKGNTTA